MAGRSKYRKVADLYITGTTVVFKDGTPMWVQALNPYEFQEAQQRASAARSRFAMAVKEIGNAAYEDLQGMLAEMASEEKTERIVSLEASKQAREIVYKIQEEEDWRETVEVLRRSEDLEEGSEEEQALVKKKAKEYEEEISRRIEDERDYQLEKWAKEPDERRDSYLCDFWIDMQGGERSLREFELSEVFQGCRVCDATQDDDGEWQHDGCNHDVPAFADMDEVRNLPQEMWDEIRLGFDTVNMDPREAGNSPRLGSSSDPSQQPSKEAESQPSTQPEESETAPGTSPTPSATP